MNAKSSHIMKRTFLSLAFGICLLLVGTPDASAHWVGHRPPVVKNYVPGRSVFFPAWLRRNRDFQHWYWHNRYRFKRHVSWIRLYDIYRFEKRFYRFGGRYYQRHYADRGYITYYRKPGRMMIHGH